MSSSSLASEVVLWRVQSSLLSLEVLLASPKVQVQVGFLSECTASLNHHRCSVNCPTVAVRVRTPSPRHSALPPSFLWVMLGMPLFQSPTPCSCALFKSVSIGDIHLFEILKNRVTWSEQCSMQCNVSSSAATLTVANCALCHCDTLYLIS